MWVYIKGFKKAMCNSQNPTDPKDKEVQYILIFPMRIILFFQMSNFKV